jgi:hypothetical protein
LSGHQFPRFSPDVRPALIGGLCHFWALVLQKELRVRLGHRARITRYDAVTSDSGRAFRDSSLKVLPGVPPKALSRWRGIFEQGNFPCYDAITVQAGMPMTVKEMGLPW